MTDKIERRLKHLEDAHKHQHAIVEALIAEKAPDQHISKAKKEKLRIKDMITTLKETCQCMILTY
jgi:hypothetical protein